MTDKQLQTISGGDLAIGIQFATSIGERRSLTLTTGVPLDYEQKQINGILDKLADGAEHLQKRYRYLELKDFLERTESQLAIIDVQIEHYKTNAEASWQQANKRGQWSPDGRQKAELENFEKSKLNLVAQTKKMRAELKDLEKVA